MEVALNTGISGKNRQAVAGEVTTSISSDCCMQANKLPNFEGSTLCLPESHQPYTDKYFLRSNQILQAEGLNPYVRAQVFIRKGPGQLAGIDQAVAMLEKYGNITAKGGKIYALPEGATYNPLESVLIVEARIQDFIELETVYLGVIAAETTKLNDGVAEVNLKQVTERVSKIKELIGDRSLTYFGARHWSFQEDAAIAAAAIAGGANGASTDIGARVLGLSGVGTIPHALENIYAAKVGAEQAVLAATLAFDRVIEPEVPRIALIDYNNKEIDDSLAVAKQLGKKLTAVRVDTCGENVAQGAFKTIADIPDSHPLQEVINQVPANELKYWVGNGVCVSGVFALVKALEKAGHSHVGVILTSGFGSVEKVAAFVRAEKLLGIKLFDGLGVGGLYSPCRTSTMDIVAVADRVEDLDRFPMSKVGRQYRPNNKLELVNGKL